MTVEQNAICPFQSGTMITRPERFWGRNYEKAALIVRIQNMGSSSIVGERRIGKSSLAYYFYSYLISNYSAEYEPVWIDCQSNFSKTVDGLFRQISSCSSINYVNGKAKQDCMKNFEIAINTSPKKIVLFIDEFEILTDKRYKKQFSQNFYEHIRMLASKGNNLALIVISKDGLPEICKHTLGVSSPFYNIFSNIQLDNFSKEETENFINSEHAGFTFSKSEKKFIKTIDNYCHPLVLQVIGEMIFLNRNLRESDTVISKKIAIQVKNYLNHGDVETERIEETKMATKKNEPKQMNKALDMTLSILLLVLGLTIIIVVFTWAITELDYFKSVLLALFSILTMMLVILFAGRSIDIIGETTFFKIFTQIIKKVPLLSKLLDINIKK